jgi:hypothetical protein
MMNYQPQWNHGLWNLKHPSVHAGVYHNYPYNWIGANKMYAHGRRGLDNIPHRRQELKNMGSQVVSNNWNNDLAHDDLIESIKGNG